MKNNNQIVALFKKHRITILSVLTLLVAFSCIFAFAGNNQDASDAESVSENRVGEAIYVDGCLVSAFDSVDEANAVIDSALANRVNSLGIDNDSEASFNNRVEIVNGEYPEEAFLGEEALSLLGETVCDYNGAELPVKLTVRSVKTLNKDVVIEHDTKTIYTDALANGVKKVISEGFDGVGVETYEVISLDGVETETAFVSLEVTSEAIDEVAQVGTRSNGKEVASLNIFTKPFEGIITSYMGPRWGRIHSGIDIWYYECFGKPVVACADGVVILSKYYGTYGNCVIVDHGDGVQTLYAHFSKLEVEVGDTVKAGDVVGLIGSTGNSTGPHLHLEVHVDGERVNPLIFVDYE